MAPPVTWKVTNQLETTDLTPTGQAARGVKVTFQLSTGEFGSVFVTQAQYTPDAVTAAIAQQAQVMIAVKGLTG